MIQLTDIHKRSAWIMAVLVMLSLTACTRDSPEPVLPEEAFALESCSPITGEVQVETVASGLVVPWDIVFLGEDRILVTERTGAIRLIQSGTLQSDPWATLPVAAEGVIGLTSIALAPDFDDSGHVYVAATFSRIGDNPLDRQLNRVKRQFAKVFGSDSRFPYETRVIRLRDTGSSGVVEQIVVRGIPSDPWHGTSSLAFGPDGMLYVSTGYASEPKTAQSTRSLGGKILRFTPSGDIPSDNPDPESPVFALGFRQSQGLVWVSGTLIATEHGAAGFDELNVVERSTNYGWPLESGAGSSHKYAPPIVTWDTSVAPSGIAFYSRADHDWGGSLFVGTLVGRKLLRLQIDEDADEVRVLCQESLLADEVGRVRSVRQGLDGELYVSTSNRDHRGAPAARDDRVLRVSLKKRGAE